MLFASFLLLLPGSCLCLCSFDSLIIICLGVVFFTLNLIGDLRSSYIWIFTYFFRFGKFAVTVSLNKLYNPLSSLLLNSYD